MKTTISTQAGAVEPLPARMDNEPSKEARNVVSTLWPDLEGKEKMVTNWGYKTAWGLAASIDELAGLPKLLRERDELLAALKDIIEAYPGIDNKRRHAAIIAIAAAERSEP